MTAANARRTGEEPGRAGDATGPTRPRRSTGRSGRPSAGPGDVPTEHPVDGIRAAAGGHADGHGASDPRRRPGGNRRTPGAERTEGRSPDRANPSGPADGAPVPGPVAQWQPAPTSSPEGAAASAVLRANEPPADERDLYDRQKTLAISSDAMLERHRKFEDYETTRDWHRTLQSLLWTVVGLFGTIVLVILYVVLVVALRHVAPDLTLKQDMALVGAAVGTAVGGGVAGLAGGILRARYTRRPGTDEASASRPPGARRNTGR